MASGSRGGSSHFLLFLVIFCCAAALPLSSQQDSGRAFTVVTSDQRLNWNPVLSMTSTEAQLYTAVYEGLVALGPQNLAIVPGLASEWTLSPNKLTYTFQIRPGLKFSTGEPITSADFRDTWLYLLSLGDRAAFGYLLDPVVGAKDYRTGKTDASTVGIEAPRPDRLIVRLSQPAPHFTSILAHQSLVPLPPAFRNGDRWPTAEGLPASGPYRVVSASRTDVRLAKNPDYWDRDRVTIQNLRFRMRNDPARNTADFNSGDVDWIMDGVAFGQLRVPDSVQLNAQFGTSYLFFNTSKPGLSDPRVRRALALLLPLGEMRSDDLNFIPAATLIPKFEGYPEAEHIEDQNLQEALALLEEAGYPAGEGLPRIRVVSSGSADGFPQITMLEQAWKTHLVTEIEVEYLDFYDQMDRVDASEFEIAPYSWVADYLDPLTLIELWAEGNPVNTGKFSDPEFERLLALAANQEGAARFRTLSQAESILLSTGTVIPFAHTPAINIIDLQDVEGWFPNPMDHHPFKYLKFKGSRIPPGVAILTSEPNLAIVSR